MSGSISTSFFKPSLHSRMSLPILLLHLSFILLSGNSANSANSAKRVLPGSLVRRQIEKTSAENLWRLVLTSEKQEEEEAAQQRTELEDLIKELTYEILVLATNDMHW